jgi:protein ImuB
MTLFANKQHQRILALWFPRLPAERVLRQRFGRSWRSRMPATQPPLLFSSRENNTQRVAALDERAAALGLRCGLGIAEARAMHPSVEVIEAEPEADRRLLEALADWCDRYTPLVALDGEDGLFLDITGCAHLFGGERALLDDLLARFFHQGFEVRAVLASTPGAAWAAARYGTDSVIEQGEEAGSIAPLPLAALRLNAKICAGLESVGLRFAGAILDLPRAPLVRRFGKIVTLRIDQALGRVDEPISPRLAVPALIMERHFAEPIALMEDIETLVTALSRQLKSELERRGEGAQLLQLQLFRVDGAVARINVATSRPSRDPAVIRRLFHEKLSVCAPDLDAGFGFDLVRLAVMAAAPLEEEQVRLDAAGPDRDGDMTLFADKVRARLGERALTRPQMIESHIPERAARPVSLCAQHSSALHSSSARPAPPPGLAALATAARQRPIRLFDHPERIDITSAEVPEGPPSHFRWRRASYRVAAAEGPERIAPEWWRDDQSDTRDYFRVEDDSGRRYWLYRQGFYDDPEAAPRWFMHGVFA